MLSYNFNSSDRGRLHSDACSSERPNDSTGSHNGGFLVIQTEESSKNTLISEYQACQTKKILCLNSQWLTATYTKQQQQQQKSSSKTDVMAISIL